MNKTHPVHIYSFVKVDELKENNARQRNSPLNLQNAGAAFRSILVSRRINQTHAPLHARVLRARPHRASGDAFLELDLADAAAAAAGLCRGWKDDHGNRKRLLRRWRLQLPEGGCWTLAGWRCRLLRQAEDGMALGDEGHDGEVVAGADLDHEAVGVVEEELVHVDAALLHAQLHVPDAQLLEPPLHRLHALALHVYMQGHH